MRSKIGWTVATLFAFLFIFWWAASDQLATLTPPENALEIHVVAKQWMWHIQHPTARAKSTSCMSPPTPMCGWR